MLPDDHCLLLHHTVLPIFMLVTPFLIIAFEVERWLHPPLSSDSCCSRFQWQHCCPRVAQPVIPWVFFWEPTGPDITWPSQQRRSAAAFRGQKAIVPGAACQRHQPRPHHHRGQSNGMKRRAGGRIMRRWGQMMRIDGSCRKTYRHLLSLMDWINANI